MSRKTRQQKIIASLRREIQFKSQQEAYVPPTPQQKFTYTVATTSTIPSQHYPYLIHDLLKTLILTSSIVVLELIIFFFTKVH